MKQARELYNTLKEIFNNGDEVFPAIVTSVDKGNCVCDVEYDELELGNIRLKATVDNEKGVKLFPKVGSVVLVQKLGAMEEMFVTLVSEVDEVVYEVGDCVFKIDDGYTIAKGTDSVKALFADLLDAIKALTVPTNAGPSGVPINLASFEAIETRANEIFK